MTYFKRIPTLIAALSVLLAGAGGAASAAVTSEVTAALVKGEFVGPTAHWRADIGLSSNGKQVVAYLCNGTTRHVSLAQWFKGPVTSSRIDITNTHGTHLVATVRAHAIKGTITLKGGRSTPFTARLLPSASRRYGLFRSEETLKGVRYLGGWILVPPAKARSRTAGQAFLASVVTPLLRAGGIINVRTGALIVSPRLRNLVRVTVPHLGTFRLTRCHQAHC
jgi:hypothetical protein